MCRLREEGRYLLFVQGDSVAGHLMMCCAGEYRFLRLLISS